MYRIMELAGKMNTQFFSKACSGSVVHKNQICYLVCTKPIITHSRETDYFRVAQAWVLGGIPEIHITYQNLDIT